MDTDGGRVASGEPLNLFAIGTVTGNLTLIERNHVVEWVKMEPINVTRRPHCELNQRLFVNPS